MLGERCKADSYLHVEVLNWSFRDGWLFGVRRLLVDVRVDVVLAVYWNTLHPAFFIADVAGYGAHAEDYEEGLARIVEIG